MAFNACSIHPDCNFPLGLENYDVEDYQLTASDTEIFSSKEFFPPWNARYNSTAFHGVNNFGREHKWYRPKTVPGDWLQIDLLASHLVTGLGFQGDPLGKYMKTFYLAYSSDMVDWTYYEDATGNRQVCVCFVLAL